VRAAADGHGEMVPSCANPLRVACAKEKLLAET